MTIVSIKIGIQNLVELGKRWSQFIQFIKSEKDATNGMTILPQMCENDCLSAPTLLLIKQYITLSAMLNFSSIHATPMVIEVVLSALKCKLFFRGRPECPKIQAVFNLTCDRLEIEIDLSLLRISS